VGWDQLGEIAEIQRAEAADELALDAKPWYCPLCLTALRVRRSVRDCPYGHYTADV